MTLTRTANTLLQITLLIFSLFLFNATAQAASCKGQAKSACSAASNCYWVDAYKRKDGVKVKSHCRTKAGKASTKKKKTTQSSGKKKSTKATTDTGSKKTKAKKAKKKSDKSKKANKKDKKKKQ